MLGHQYEEHELDGEEEAGIPLMVVCTQNSQDYEGVYSLVLVVDNLEEGCSQRLVANTLVKDHAPCSLEVLVEDNPYEEAHRKASERHNGVLVEDNPYEVAHKTALERNNGVLVEDSRHEAACIPASDHQNGEAHK